MHKTFLKRTFFALALLVCLSCQKSIAQVNYNEFITSGEQTSYYKRAVNENLPVAIPMRLEVNVKFSKRIIRCIDTRQKMNKQLTD